MIISGKAFGQKSFLSLFEKMAFQNGKADFPVNFVPLVVVST